MFFVYRIDDFRKCSSLSKIAITKHAKSRLEERNIKVCDIVNAIKNGEIIKQYENDTPLPSCLILGKNIDGKPIHIVAGTDGDFVYLITAYFPTTENWSEDFKTRRKNDLH